jgi:hypothetical protein
MSIGYVLSCHPDCCDFVKATPCAGQGVVPDLYIKRSKIPAGWTSAKAFKVGALLKEARAWEVADHPELIDPKTYCFTVNPAGPKVFPPRGSNAWADAFYGSTAFYVAGDTCADCLAPPPERPPGDGGVGNPGRPDPHGGGNEDTGTNLDCARHEDWGWPINNCSGPPGGSYGGFSLSGQLYALARRIGLQYPDPKVCWLFSDRKRRWILPPPSDPPPPGWVPTPVNPSPYPPPPGDPDWGIQYISVYGVCGWFDPSIPPVRVLDPRQFVTAYGTYNSCGECNLGIPAYPCPGQGANFAPLYFKKEYFQNEDGSVITGAEGVKFFRYGEICYHFDPSETAVAVPQGLNVILSYVESQFSECKICNLGVVAELCPDQDPRLVRTAYKLWIPEDRLPDVQVWFKFNRLCYTLDPAGAKVFRPADHSPFTPIDEYANCAACFCGDRSIVHGVKADLCSGQDPPANLRELWVARMTAPARDYFFEWRRLCWRLKKDRAPAYIPPGVDITTQPGAGWNDCVECKAGESNQTPPEPPTDPPDPPDPPPTDPADPPPWFPPPVHPPGGGGTGYPPGGNPPFPPKPPWDNIPNPPKPPRPPFPPGGGDSLKLAKCSDGTLTGGSVLKSSGVAGKVIRDGDECLVVTALETSGGTPVDQYYYTCAHCENSKRWLPLKKCSDNSPAGWVSKLEYIQGGGQDKPVYILEPHVCAYVAGPETLIPPVSVVSGQRVATCADPLCAPGTCPTLAELTAAGCDGPMTASMDDNDPNINPTTDPEGCFDLSGAIVMNNLGGSEWHGTRIISAGCTQSAHLNCTVDGGVAWWELTFGISTAGFTHASTFRKLAVAGNPCPPTGAYTFFSQGGSLGLDKSGSTASAG